MIGRSENVRSDTNKKTLPSRRFGGRVFRFESDRLKNPIFGLTEFFYFEIRCRIQAPITVAPTSVAMLK